MKGKIKIISSHASRHKVITAVLQEGYFPAEQHYTVGYVHYEVCSFLWYKPLAKKVTLDGWTGYSDKTFYQLPMGYVSVWKGSVTSHNPSCCLQECISLKIIEWVPILCSVTLELLWEAIVSVCVKDCLLFHLVSALSCLAPAWRQLHTRSAGVHFSFSVGNRHLGSRVKAGFGLCSQCWGHQTLLGPVQGILCPDGLHPTSTWLLDSFACCPYLELAMRRS